VRKISYGEGVERVFPLYSPMIDSIDVVRRGKVRRAKLYYLRELRGKSARITERQAVRTAGGRGGIQLIRVGGFGGSRGRREPAFCFSRRRLAGGFIAGAAWRGYIFSMVSHRQPVELTGRAGASLPLRRVVLADHVRLPWRFFGR
jgi:hypothetical protein